VAFIEVTGRCGYVNLLHSRHFFATDVNSAIEIRLFRDDSDRPSIPRFLSFALNAAVVLEH